jgi:hypothetical protein
MRAFLIIVAVLIIAGVGLAFYQDWFHLTVDKDKMQADTAGAKDKVQAVVDKVKGKTGSKDAGAKTVTGTVNKVEAGDNRFSMTTTDNDKLTLYADPSFKLRRNDQDVELGQLEVKDEVKVTYEAKDGKNHVTSVAVNQS